MLAERESRVGRRLLRPAGAALAMLLGLAGAVVGATSASPADAASPVKLAIVVPFVVPPGTGSLLTIDELTQYTSPLGLLTRQLDAVIDTPVTVALDPMIIVSIRALGASVPASAKGWLDRLATATNETFALAYDDTDLTLATQAGAATVPTPQSFDFALDPANFAPATDSTATPTPTPDPDTTVLPALPTTRTLLDWPYSLAGVAWPRPDTVTNGDLKHLVASGYTATILSSKNVARGSAAGSAVDIGGDKAAVADERVSTALGAAARAVSDESWDAAMADLLDAIAAAGRTQPEGGATVLAAFDREVPFTGGRLSQTLAQLAADAGIRQVPLSSIIAAQGSAATVVDSPQDANRVALVTQAFDSERSEQQFASVAQDALHITAPRRLQLLGLLADEWEQNPAGWTLAANEFLTTSVELTSSVSVVESSGINLLADRATLPITVANNLDQAITVYISVRPDTGLLAVESSRVELVVEPNSQGKGQIPVQAISNGKVGLTIALTSASGVSIGQSARVSINVQAGWETPIVITMAALVVMLFAFGIIRTVLRRRGAGGGDGD